MSLERRDGVTARGLLHLNQRLLSRIGEFVETDYPEEACGGLLGVVRDDGAVEVVDALPLSNRREDGRRRRYLIGPDDVLELERRATAADLLVVGYYHSHPDAPAVPSTFDRDNAWPWYVYLILSVEAGKWMNAKAWRLSAKRDAFEPVMTETDST